jgi:TonB family protein
MKPTQTRLLTFLIVPLAMWAHTGHAIAQDTAGNNAVPAPPLSIPNTMPFYPAEAKRLGLTGRVGLECSIDMNGHPQNITVVEPSGSLLDKQAVQLLSIGHFDLPEDWLVTGGPEKRYRIGMTFELSNKPPVPKFQDGRTTVNVKGSGIP